MQKFNRSQDGGPQKRGQADNRLGERIAHPKNFQRENQSRGKLESTFLVTILARTEVSRPKKAAKKANKTRRFY